MLKADWCLDRIDTFEPKQKLESPQHRAVQALLLGSSLRDRSLLAVIGQTKLVHDPYPTQAWQVKGARA